MKPRASPLTLPANPCPRMRARTAAGIRPGEKLYEELLSAKEKVNDQVYEKIFVGNVQSLPKTEVDSYVDSLLTLGVNDLKDSLVKFAQQ